MTSKRNFIIVYRGDIAKILFREKYELVDFQENKLKPNQTVFFFRNVPGLEERLAELTKKYSRKSAVYLPKGAKNE